MISSTQSFISLHAPKTGGNRIQTLPAPFRDDTIILSAHQDGYDRFGIRGDVTPFKHVRLSDYADVPSSKPRSACARPFNGRCRSMALPTNGCGKPLESGPLESGPLKSGPWQISAGTLTRSGQVWTTVCQRRKLLHFGPTAGPSPEPHRQYEAQGKDSSLQPTPPGKCHSITISRS